MTRRTKKLNITHNLLQDIELAMDHLDPESQWYLDIETEEVRFVSEHYSEDEELDNAIENDTSGRYIPVPARSSREGWEQMEKFIQSLDDQDEIIRDLLLNTISGRGAFTRFKDSLYRIGLLEKWYEFKGMEDRKAALQWLLSENLITEAEINIGVRFYEDWLSAKQKRQKDMDNMNTGAMVKCTDNAGYENQVTKGKIYQVIDERKENLNIRIKDDRDNVRWYPKSHFELLPLRKV